MGRLGYNEGESAVKKGGKRRKKKKNLRWGKERGQEDVVEVRILNKYLYPLIFCMYREFKYYDFLDTA